MGKVGKVAPNIVNRDFKATRPNQLWLTDVTEFRIKGKEEKIYLSPILDVYNSEIISYTISNHPTIELTNSMLDKALRRIREEEKKQTNNTFRSRFPLSTLILVM